MLFFTQSHCTQLQASFSSASFSLSSTKRESMIELIDGVTLPTEEAAQSPQFSSSSRNSGVLPGTRTPLSTCSMEMKAVSHIR